MNPNFLILILGITYLLPFSLINKNRLSQDRVKFLTLLFIFPFFQEFIQVFLSGHISFNSLVGIDQDNQASLNTYYYFAIMCNLFKFICFKIISDQRKYKSENLILKKFFDKSKFRIFIISLILIWILVTGGQALINPRYAYQVLRVGKGPIWSFLISSVSFYSGICVFQREKIRLFDDILILFSTIVTGSKGVFLWLNSFYYYALGIKGFKNHLNQFRLSKYSKLLLIILAPSLVLYLIALFGGGGEFGLITKVLNYKNSTSFAVRAITEWKEKDFSTNGQIFLTSFWSFIPRAIFPNKPFAYGNLLILEKFFPGMAETGHTPSFGLYLDKLIDFGWIGFVTPVFLNLKFLIQLYGFKVITQSEYVNNFIPLIATIYCFIPLLGAHFPFLLLLPILYFIYNFCLVKKSQYYNY
tara:strand:- start:18182 stop:19423 length:1242 start_codon:yes stop_codon:yes gene_type:complete